MDSMLQLAEDESAAGPSALQPGDSEPAPGLAPAPEINVDELTRRVYQEIKRRLSTEWERMRRRL